MHVFGYYVPRRILFLLVLDGLVFFSLPLGLSQARHDCASCGGLPSLDPLGAFALAAALLLLTVALGLYNSDASYDFRTFCKRFALSWEFIVAAAVGFLALTGAAAGARLGWSIGLVAAGVVSIMTLQFGLHLALEWWLSRPRMRRRIMVLGDTPAAEEIGAFLRSSAARAFDHVETLRNWSGGDGPLPAPAPGALLATAAPAASPALPRLVEQLRCNEIVVATLDRAAVPADELLECKLRGVAVTDALAFWEREAGLIDIGKTQSAHMAFSSGFNLSAGRMLTKRLADMLISSVFLVLVAPLCLLVAALIWIESPGPIFYRQERVGLNGRVFQVWKFRSMRTDAEVDGAPRWAASSDDRVTRVGRFIRKVRIDEIPQVLNVLAGEMSFIGPRPERPFFVDQLREQIPHYDLRHRVPPGITGWAQVNYPYGASVEDAKRKLAYDLYYVKRYSLLLDLVILLQTIRVVLFAHGSR